MPSEYIITNGQIVNVDDIEHHGVKGMKWGKRKARYDNISTNGSKKRAYEAAQKKLAAAKANKKMENKEYDKAYSRAYNSSARHPITQWTGGKNQKKVDANWDAAIEKAKSSEKANRQYKAAKKAAKAAKKMAKVEMKAVKQKYREQYMKGKSAVGKVLAKLTDGDRIYADAMYDLNKGVYKDKPNGR